MLSLSIIYFSIQWNWIFISPKSLSHEQGEKFEESAAWESGHSGFQLKCIENIREGSFDEKNYQTISAPPELLPPPSPPHPSSTEVCSSCSALSGSSAENECRVQIGE